jgi:hypothetical protein
MMPLIAPAVAVRAPHRRTVYHAESNGLLHSLQSVEFNGIDRITTARTRSAEGRHKGYSRCAIER